ncbi:hypothetical protein GZL_01474 [Streptomyces sp. 769]|nr:hypothetical protein GZL_01474 [Streptomyces sp. 769]
MPPCRIDLSGPPAAVRDAPVPAPQHLVAEPVRGRHVPAPGRRNHFSHGPELRVERQRIRLPSRRTQSREKRNHTASVDGGGSQGGLHGRLPFQKITQ